MKKITIYIPIEIKARELPSTILFSSFLSTVGCRTYIGSKGALNRITRFKSCPNGIYLFKGGLSFKDIVKLKKVYDFFVIIDQEIAPSCINYQKEIRRRIWPGSEPEIDRYYVVGEEARKSGVACLQGLEANVVDTGWPRVDLWRNEFRHIYKTKVDNIRKKHGNYILFSSAFCYNSQKKIDDILELQKNHPWESVRTGFEEEKNRAKNAIKEFHSNIQMLQELDDDKKCPQIIIRPHPAEDHDVWYRISKTFKRIKVIFEGEISPWIYASSALLHRGCASAVQAYMAGLPTGYPIVKDEWIKKALPYDISEHLYSTKEIADFCKKYIGHKPVPPSEYSDLFKNNVHIEKDKFASELIIEDMLKLGAIPEPPYQATMKDRAYDILPHVRKGLNGAIQYFFKQEQNIGIAPQSQKMPGGITKAEVKDFLSLIDPNRKFKVRQVSKDCVEIEE